MKWESVGCSFWSQKSSQSTKMKLPTLALVLVILLAAANGVNGVCPPGCTCDDESLHVNCLDANLDIVPITLNPSVRKLILKNNRIKSVDTGFNFYQALTLVDLSHNHLVKIQQGSFASQTKLIELNLNANKISHLSNKTFGGPNNSLAILNLKENHLVDIEPEIFIYTKQLEDLDLGQNNIKKLNKSAFAGLTNLRFLKLNNNELTRVPDVFAKGVSQSLIPQLVELSLAANSIDRIDNDAFGSVRNLQTLDLRGNRIASIEPNAFNNLNFLRKLNLEDNNLKRVPASSFLHLGQLENLKIGKNPIALIGKGEFGGLRNLKTLEISGASELQTIDQEAFNLNIDLADVEVSGSKKLIFLPHSLFKGLSSLKIINLKENGLVNLPEDLASWQSLRNLRLEGNPFRCECSLLWLRDLFNEVQRFKNSSSFVLCAEPGELNGRRISALTNKDLNCGLNGPMEKTVIGIAICVTIIALVAFFIALYRYHDRIKNACKRCTFFRRSGNSNRRKSRSSVISSGKDLDTATKTSFLSHSGFPYGASDDEFAVRTSLMNSPPPNSAALFHHPAHFHHQPPMPPMHHHHSMLHGGQFPSSYNEYDTPMRHHLNTYQQYPQHQSHQSHSHSETLESNGIHQQFPLGVHPMKQIPITEL